MKENLSIKLKALSFVSIVFVVLVHSQTSMFNVGSHTNYMSSKSAQLLQLFLSDGLARVGVPFFFMSSSFFFFLGGSLDLYSYKHKLKKRLRTLIIPYLTWSALGLLFFLLIQTIPSVSRFFTNKLVRNYELTEVFYRWIVSPLNYQLWFIRDLLIVMLFSPLFYFFVKKNHYFFLVPFFLLWLSDINLIVRADTYFFFFLGAMVALKYKNLIEFTPSIFKTLVISLVWLLLVLFKSKMSLQGFQDSLVFYLISKFSILVGLVSFWYLYDIVLISRTLCRLHEKYRVFEFTFFLYLSHEPLLTIIKKILMSLIHVKNFFTYSFIYLGSPFITIIICIQLGLFLKKYSHKTYDFLTGNR